MALIVLENVYTKFGQIQIMKSDNGTITYCVSKLMYTEVMADGVCPTSYIHAMSNMVLQSGAKRVAMIGCAGGTLATLLHHGGCHVTAVDIDPYSFIYAKRYFNLPDAVECVTQDGMEFLKESNTRFDAIALDAFGPDGQVAKGFISTDFFRIVRDRLSPEGVMVMNLISGDDGGAYADNVARHVVAAGLPAYIFDMKNGKEIRNVLIASGFPESIDVTLGCQPDFVTAILQKTTRRKHFS